MTLQEFVQQGWADHGDDAEGVFARLPEGVGLVTDAGDLPSLAALVVHVAGEHLGKWDEGVALLGRLTEHELFDDAAPAGKSVWRSLAVLHHCAGNDAERADCMERGRSGDGSAASDEVRVLAIATSALAGQKRTDEALTAFTRALALAEYGPLKGDPAANALAITGNNLACELEEKPDRTDDEARLMLEAARTGRRFWEIVGTWTNVERAEYRLAMTHLQRGEAGDALEHATLCHDVCRDNEADAVEFFFAHEALSKAWKAKGDAAQATRHRDAAAGCIPRIEVERLVPYCEGELAKLDAALA